MLMATYENVLDSVSSALDPGEPDTGAGNSAEQGQDVSQPGTDGTENPQQSEQHQYEWMNDPRAGTHWENNPDKLYNSYREIESKFTQKTQQNAEIQKQLESMQAETEKYQKLAGFLESVNQNPEFADKFGSVFDEWNKHQQREKYGMLLPDNLISQLSKTEQLEQQLQEIKQQEEVNQIGQKIDSTVSDIANQAKEYGIQFNEHEFLKYCHENAVPVAMMQAVFLQHSMKHILEAQKSRIQQTVTKNVQGNLNRGTGPAGNSQQGADVASAAQTLGDISAKMTQILSG